MSSSVFSGRPVVRQPHPTTCLPHAKAARIEVVVYHGEKSATFSFTWADYLATVGWVPRDVRNAPSYGEAEYVMLSGVERGRLVAIVKRGRAGPRTAALAVARPLAALGYAPRLARMVHAGQRVRVTLELVPPPAGRSDHHGFLEMLGVA